MSILTRVFGDASGHFLGKTQTLLEAVNHNEPTLQVLSDEQLRGKTDDFKRRLGDGTSLDDLLPEAFAVVREAARRTLGQRHYDVQIIGGTGLHEGKIVEMRTGEGKTLVATLPAYLNALKGLGVHVVTVNDYLARRDAVWMGQIYNFLGLSVGVINDHASYLYDPSHVEKDIQRDTTGSFKVVHEFLRPCGRVEAYAADITYGTNSEFGFDYLRDNLAYRPVDLVQREHSFAIVDEVDSILIDEARTPLIISSPDAQAEGLYRTFTKVVSALEEGRDYTVDHKMKAIQLTDEGISRAEKALGVENLYTEGGIKLVHHLETAVRARALYHREKEYVVRDGKVVIVDEFTGRLQPSRRWSEGLHQAIEAKEGVSVQQESRTAASVTYQNYFRMYRKLSGMTGTALTSSEEFQKVYGLETVAVPPNKTSQRGDLNDLVFQTEKGKLIALAKRVRKLYESGQPVLIGTVSIEKNEVVSAYLKTEGVPHQILNAKNHEQEGEIIAQAGRAGAVTVATNMAGRGVDIILGGNPPDHSEQTKVREAGGLFVIGTERHEARRIDNQLRGRSGRQGDPGSTQFYLSLEDTLMRIFASDFVKNMMGKFGIPEDEPIQNKMVSRAIESAQEKIEGLNFDARRHVLEYDNVMNHHRKIIYERRRKLLTGDREFLKSRLEELVAGDKQLSQAVEEKTKELGEEIVLEGFRLLSLQVTDMHWLEHLESMEYLRSSVRLRAYGQRDPLIEYKREGLRLFKTLEGAMDDDIAKYLPHMSVQKRAAGEGALRPGHVQGGAKVGRNDPCPCGSGLKYKKCGLINAPEHAKPMSKVGG